jgi:hypothetical protein
MKQDVFLALRKTDAPGIGKIFSKLTRARIITKYPHAGIMINGTLLHITAKNGMRADREINLKDWEFFCVDADSSEVIKRFEEHKSAKYDWLSLLAFVLPWRVSVSKWLYCYEWCYLALTGIVPKRRITPEELLTYSRGRYVVKS